MSACISGEPSLIFVAVLLLGLIEPNDSGRCNDQNHLVTLYYTIRLDKRKLYLTGTPEHQPDSLASRHLDVTSSDMKDDIFNACSSVDGSSTSPLSTIRELFPPARSVVLLSCLSVSILAIV